MSTWTNERHEQVRRRLDAADGALHCGWDDGLDEPMQEVVANAYDDLADALDEIERLRALTIITDNMVEKACKADYEYDNGYRIQRSWDDVPKRTELLATYYRLRMRATLEAALNTKEED